MYPVIAMLMPQFACACGKSYRLKQLLVRHQRYECGREPMFQCPFCPRRLTHKHNLNRHIKFVHTKGTINQNIS
ncbi:hypothetical protein J6590_002363 [Homalodisca vitripennis]|nr:hypothetical protein J6590_002363 [Homalodisca vitripennis]